MMSCYSSSQRSHSSPSRKAGFWICASCVWLRYSLTLFENVTLPCVHMISIISTHRTSSHVIIHVLVLTFWNALCDVFAVIECSMFICDVCCLRWRLIVIERIACGCWLFCVWFHGLLTRVVWLSFYMFNIHLVCVYICFLTLCSYPILNVICVLFDLFIIVVMCFTCFFVC